MAQHNTSSSGKIRGRIYVLGDNIDTDCIIPAEFLSLVPTISEEYRKLGSHALAGLPDTMPRFVREGKTASEFAVIIAGRNFGCGSSREHAPIALGAAGVKAVVAQSYARIFFRNAVATGELYPLESRGRLCDIFHTGEDAEIDLESSTILHVDSGKSFALKGLGAAAPVIQAGGIFAFARARGLIGDKGRSPAKPSPRETTRSRIVAVANQKGGVGKTTTAVNLAAFAAESGKRVLLVDLDPQANATSGLGLDREQGFSLYQPLLGRKSVEGLVKSTEMKRLDVIPSELDLAGAEVDLVHMDNYLRRLSTALAPVLETGKYDLLLIDCPPSLGVLTANALTLAHSALIPIQCEYYALEGLSVIKDFIAQLRENGANPGLAMEGILLTMYDKRTRLSSDVLKEVRKHFGKAVYRTVIPRNIRLSEAPSFGKPILSYASHSAGAAAYKRFAREFLKRMKLIRR
ncbi:MAG: AAA family ATPase [Kiritimatiellia bacterium]